MKLKYRLSRARSARRCFPRSVTRRVSCTRGGLQQAVDLYIAAQTKGDLSGLPLASNVGYWENIAPADIKKGFVNKPLKIDFHRSILDAGQLPVVHRGDRHRQGGAVCSRHAPARESRQDRGG